MAHPYHRHPWGRGLARGIAGLRMNHPKEDTCRGAVPAVGFHSVVSAIKQR